MSELPTPQDVIDYWIGEASASPDAAGEKHKLWFGKSEETDAEIRERFGALVETLSDLPSAEDWAASGPRERLAVIIVLDQFARNMFRGSGRSFESNDLALRHAGAALDHGFDQQVEATARQFFYLPFMHSEDLQDQDRAVRLYEALGDESSLRFARQHREIVARFGRFPHRNAVLARESTPDETEFLKTHQGF